VIEVDVAWRQSQFKVENLRADYGKVNKEVAMKKKAGENADDLIAKAKEIDTEIKVRSSRGRERGRGREGEGGHCYRANIIAFKN
jgi:seryl-tRNA synthetase